MSKEPVEALLGDISAQLLGQQRTLEGILKVMTDIRDRQVAVAARRAADPTQAALPVAVATQPATTSKRNTSPKELFTATGYVTGLEEKISKGKGAPGDEDYKAPKAFWVMSLDNEKFASVWSMTTRDLLRTALDSGRQVILEYSLNGNYKNIENVKLASARVAAPSTAPDSKAAPF